MGIMSDSSYFDTRQVDCVLCFLQLSSLLEKHLLESMTYLNIKRKLQRFVDLSMTSKYEISVSLFKGCCNLREFFGETPIHHLIIGKRIDKKNSMWRT